MKIEWQETPLYKKDLSRDPFIQFANWYQEAEAIKGPDFYPDAICLSTLNPDGYPEGRMVLLKGYDIAGFIFYTNHNSTKGKSLLAYPKATMTFYWHPFRRQVRITGDVVLASPEEADRYFASRSRMSQLGAWASRQSQNLKNRDVLEKKVQEYLNQFKGKDIPRPRAWVGFRLIPVRFEFWQERANRLHDRFLYLPGKSGWTLKRLYP